jgi:plastocyanin
MRFARLLTAAAVAGAAACSNSSTGYSSSPPPPPPPPPPGGHSTTITISNNKFTPTPDTVSAGTITFQWAAGAVTHNVTWVSGPGILPTASGDRAAGDTAYHATLQAGDYTYHCTIHAASGMNGVIHVNP